MEENTKQPLKSQTPIEEIQKHWYSRNPCNDGSERYWPTVRMLFDEFVDAKTLPLLEEIAKLKDGHIELLDQIDAFKRINSELEHSLSKKENEELKKENEKLKQIQ